MAKITRKSARKPAKRSTAPKLSAAVAAERQRRQLVMLAADAMEVPDDVMLDQLQLAEIRDANAAVVDAGELLGEDLAALSAHPPDPECLDVEDAPADAGEYLDVEDGDGEVEDLSGAAKLLADLEDEEVGDDMDDEFDVEDEDNEDDDDFDITDEDDDTLEPEGYDGTLPPVEERQLSAITFMPGMASPPAPGTPGEGQGGGTTDQGPGTKDKAATFVSLRSIDIASRVKPKVERDGNGAIRNVSIMQAGPAEGHGFVIDKTMLRQVFDQMNGGVAMRFKHPQKRGADGSMEVVDSLGTHVGRVIPRNLEAAGDDLRGDIEFGPHAKRVPGLGDVSGYLMDLAENDPEAFGLSTVFAPDDYETGPGGIPLGRSAGVAACDLTGEPASNRRGLC